MNANRLNPKMITVAREARGLTQLELADQAGINRSNISRFEQEFTGFTDDVLEKLIRALRFPESFFLQNQEILPVLAVVALLATITIRIISLRLQAR